MNTKVQSGFTLVEIAIVLVIVGLLLGGVLKGTELIENSKVKRAASEINGISTSYNSYVDRFSRIPGDDGNLAALQTRGGAWGTTATLRAGNNNGALAVTLAQTFTGGGEGTAFFQHLKAAGYIKGDPADINAAALPRNAFGGLVGITTQAMGGGLNGIKVCLSQVPGKAALALDNQLDDGSGISGNMRATIETGTPPTAPTNTALAAEYNEDNNYTVCARL